jgi:hypothetical protein
LGCPKVGWGGRCPKRGWRVDPKDGRVRVGWPKRGWELDWPKIGRGVVWGKMGWGVCFYTIGWGSDCPKIGLFVIFCLFPNTPPICRTEGSPTVDECWPNINCLFDAPGYAELLEFSPKLANNVLLDAKILLFIYLDYCRLFGKIYELIGWEVGSKLKLVLAPNSELAILLELLLLF